MLTLERFEHELLKIKSQVSPTHRGRYRSLGTSDGERCIMGQMVNNFGGLNDLATTRIHKNYLNARWPYGFIWADTKSSARSLACQSEPVEPAVYALARDAACMNDCGWTWHQIVDRLVPQVKAESVPVPEPEAIGAQ